jgi:hypothetical protein
MSDARTIDVWMLFIELGILLLMVLGILWGVPAWLDKRKEEKALQQRLASLSPRVAESLSQLVLQGMNPNDEIARTLTRFPTPIIERDFTMGWRILPEHKKSVQKWALKNQKLSASTR